jgi:hypothetical protein
MQRGGDGKSRILLKFRFTRDCGRISTNNPEWFFLGDILFMETIIVHVDETNSTMLYCPFCGLTKRASVEKIKNIRHNFIAGCKCANRFKVQLNFRRHYRKKTVQAGKFMAISPNESVWKSMYICDLSMTGVGFKFSNAVTINRDNILRVNFDLDDGLWTCIDKEVFVKFVGDKFLGCEFLDLGFEEKELGFYLVS